MPSENKRAKELLGLRPTNVMPFDQPCELGYHCPVCNYQNETDGNFDERLQWSEYNCFIWCEVCNIDYPSCLCSPDTKDATKIFLDIVEDIKKET